MPDGGHLTDCFTRSRMILGAMLLGLMSGNGDIGQRNLTSTDHVGDISMSRHIHGPGVIRDSGRYARHGLN